MTDRRHNGGPPIEALTPARKIERILSLLDRDGLTSAQKCVGVKIIAEADRDGAASVRTPELMRAASARDRETVFRATKALGDAGIEKASGLGQAGRYVVLPDRVVAAVVEAYESKKSGRHEPDQSEQMSSGETRPDAMTDPVGLDPTSPAEPVGLNGTGTVEPVGINPTGRHEPDRSLARAYKESPTEITSYESVEGVASHAPLAQPKMATDKPHMNGVGFVISEKHGLFIDSETITRWRERFPHIPDLEAQMEKLSAVILAKGRMHPAWECPSGWMAGCLSDDNKRAEANAMVQAARLAKATRAEPDATKDRAMRELQFLARSAQ